MKYNKSRNSLMQNDQLDQFYRDWATVWMPRDRDNSFSLPDSLLSFKIWSASISQDLFGQYKYWSMVNKIGFEIIDVHSNKRKYIYIPLLSVLFLRMRLTHCGLGYHMANRYEDLGARSRYLRQGYVITPHSIMLEAIAYPRLRYLLLVPKS